jgi:hypothetical protein
MHAIRSMKPLHLDRIWLMAPCQLILRRRDQGLELLGSSHYPAPRMSFTVLTQPFSLKYSAKLKGLLQTAVARFS